VAPVRRPRRGRAHHPAVACRCRTPSRHASGCAGTSAWPTFCRREPDAGRASPPASRRTPGCTGGPSRVPSPALPRWRPVRQRRRLASPASASAPGARPRADADRPARQRQHAACLLL